MLPSAPRASIPGKAPVVMAERILRCYEQRQRQAKVRLVATGALTNVALLLVLYPGRWSRACICPLLVPRLGLCRVLLLLLLGACCRVLC